MVFNLKNNQKVVIDLKEFLSRQKEINKKFPNPNKKFVDIFDSMVGQIEEEIFELREAIDNNKKVSMYQNGESIEEFIDCFMYIGSLIIETASFFEIDLDKYLNENNLERISIDDMYLMNDEFYLRAIPHDEFLSFIRRGIYNRKYHKKASKPEDLKKYMDSFIKKIIVSAYYPRLGDKTKALDASLNNFRCPCYIDNMNPYLQDLLFCYDRKTIKTDDVRLETIPKRIELINSILNKKQAYIASL